MLTRSRDIGKIKRQLEAMKAFCDKYAQRLLAHCPSELADEYVAERINKFTPEEIKNLRYYATSAKIVVYTTEIKQKSSIETHSVSITKLAIIFPLSKLFNKLAALAEIGTSINNCLMAFEESEMFKSFTTLRHKMYSEKYYLRNAIRISRDGSVRDEKTYGATEFLPKLDSAVREVAYEFAMNLTEIYKAFLYNVKELTKLFAQHLLTKKITISLFGEIATVTPAMKRVSLMEDETTIENENAIPTNSVNVMGSKNTSINGGLIEIDNVSENSYDLVAEDDCLDSITPVMQRETYIENKDDLLIDKILGKLGRKINDIEEHNLPELVAHIQQVINDPKNRNTLTMHSSFFTTIAVALFNKQTASGDFLKALDEEVKRLNVHKKLFAGHEHSDVNNVAELTIANTLSSQSHFI